MPPRPSACRQPPAQLAAPSVCPHIWISDRQLTLAYDRFARLVRKRHGSSVAGPLEAQRRLAKRKMGGLSIHQTPAIVDMGSLFGSQLLQQQQHKHESQSFIDTRFPSTLVPHHDIQHRKAVARRWQTEPGPIFQALFGPKEDDKDVVQLKDEQAMAEEDNGFMDKTSVKILLEDNAPLCDVFECLGNLSSAAQEDTNFLDFLTYTTDIPVSETEFFEFISCLRQGLTLGVVSMLELNQILDKLPSWLLARFEDNNTSQSLLANTIHTVYQAVEGCRIQTLDRKALKKMRALVDNVVYIPGMTTLRFELYRASWPCPDADNYSVSKHIHHWLSLIQVNNSRDEVDCIEPQFTLQHIQHAVDHLCDITYLNDEQVCTTETELSHRENIITDVTGQVCQNARPFLEAQTGPSAAKDHQLRQIWFKLLLNSKAFQRTIAEAPTFHIMGGQPSYKCPKQWFDVLEIVTRHLPLDSVLELIPNLTPMQHCRLLFIFSFGPTIKSKRITISSNLPSGRAQSLYRKAALNFERNCESIHTRELSMARTEVFAAFVGAFSKLRFDNANQVLVVASQRLTRLIFKLRGEKATLDFLTSNAFRNAANPHDSMYQLNMLLRLFAEAYCFKGHLSEDNASAKLVWIYAKDSILQAGPRWSTSFDNLDIGPITSQHVRTNLQLLMSHVAMLAAKDKDITDRASWQIVHWLTRQLQLYKLNIGTVARHSIVMSALTRSLSSSRVPADSRVRYVLTLLQKTGLDKAMIDEIEMLLIQWRDAIRDARQWAHGDLTSTNAARAPKSHYVHHLPFVDEATAIRNAQKAGRSDVTLMVSNQEQVADSASDTSVGTELAMVLRSAMELTSTSNAHDLVRHSEIDAPRVRVVQDMPRVGDTRILKPHVSRFAQVAMKNLKLGSKEHHRRRQEQM